jgi:hypothetical protein
MPKILGVERELDSRHPHGSNIRKKLDDGGPHLSVIEEVARSYLAWRDMAEEVDYAGGDDRKYVEAQVDLYSTHRDLLDQERVDVFDSRGALQPSALEEFCGFLFHPVLRDYEGDIAVGHHLVYQRLYFTARNFADFARMPEPRYPTGNLDFVIGKALESRLRSDQDEATRTVYVPAVAVECKTYLDRPRYIESEILATNIKRGFPRCLYIVVSEYLKLDLEGVDVFGSAIDRIYVWRRAQNVDRKIRRAKGLGLDPLYAPAVLDFFLTVRDHLEQDWAAPEDWDASGILK